MKALLAALTVALCAAVSLALPGGSVAVLFCAACAVPAAVLLGRGAEGEQRSYLLKIFVGGLLVRAAVGSLINAFHLQDFFGGDALTYDLFGNALVGSWRSGVPVNDVKDWATGGGGWGMLYLVAGVYSVTGQNMLAVQLFNSVVGAATAPVIYLCARHIFQNVRVAKVAAFAVAFYPSLVLWSSQGLKDGPIVFLLALAMLATLKLGERVSALNVAMLMLSMFAIFSLRFYVFYMLAAAVTGAFVVGMRTVTSQSLARQLVIVLTIGLGLTYMGVLRTAGAQVERFGTLQAVQTSRADLAQQAKSGFGQDVDVSTATGAISAVPLGMTYLLFAPFPWQLASLRQSITLPEMIVWWASFPLLVLGVWFTLSYRLRQALPILIFTSMLTLAYSIFQGNVGTAYRQRSQILVFYFIFVAVGAVLFKERREERALQLAREKAARIAQGRANEVASAERYARWKQERGKEIEDMAQDISERINF
ncbi:MAG TPA: glycosyltransferase family 39 protein [Pyrinomonadaceae bacterium]|nr:glycosyltransferase family 39 protein [Pyrinomonadaceae bacterium]